MSRCASCERPRGNVTKQGWQRILDADGATVGWTCASCPTWDEPIRRVVIRGVAKFKATADATPRGVPRRQTSRVCGTLADARAFVAEVRAVTEAGDTYGKPEAAPSEVVVARRETLDELFSRWIESRVDVRQNTRDGYSTWLAPVRRHLGDRAVADLSIADVRELVAWLSREGGKRGQPLSSTSTRDSIKALRMALDVALEEGAIPANVARARTIRLPRESQVDPNATEAAVDYWPTIGLGDEASIPGMATFRDHADGDRYAAAWRLTLAGFTRSEVLGFRWEDVDLDAGTVSVKRGRTPRDDGTTSVDEPKSAARWRTLPVEQMHPGTMRLLRALRLRTTEERMAAGAAWTESGFLVVDQLGKPIAPRTYADRWARLCKSAGVPTIGLHKARASLAQLLIARRVPIDVAAAILGHTVAVFEAHYLPRAGADRIREHATAIIRAA